MPNELTGDFDVVAEFALPAVNRVLSGMHRIERFPHSLTMRVDDNPPRGSRFKLPSVLGLIDTFGDAVADHDRLRNPISLPGVTGPSGDAHSAFDPIVNIDVVDANVGPLVPSRLQGRAQVQVSPPSLELSSSGTSVTVRLQLMCRYFPDPGTAPAAEFVCGELRITAPVNQASSQDTNVVKIDIKAATAQISFTPQWSSQPLSPEDRAAIDQLMRNALRTGSLPMNITLPANIARANFKTLSGAPDVVALLLDMSRGLDLETALDVASEGETGPTGDPDSVTEVILGPGDDFAVAVGSEYVHTAFESALQTILTTPIDPIRIPFDAYVHTWYVTYKVILTGVALSLTNGTMVLTMNGRATTSSWTPNFDFKVRQEFTLTPSGSTVGLNVGTMSFDPSSITVSVAAWLINAFTGKVEAALRAIRDQALAESDVRGSVADLLSAEKNLGPFLTKLLTPAAGRPVQDQHPVELTYTAAQIRQAGIVLRGSLELSRAPEPRVEYEPIPLGAQQDAGPHGIGGAIVESRAYSALKSWIPGGTIQRFEWKSEGQTGPGFVDDHRFVFVSYRAPTLNGAAVENLVSYGRLCLTISGSRLSRGGPVGPQPVTASVCGYNRFPIAGLSEAAEDLVIALARPGPTGMVEVAGHASARIDPTGEASPNVIVHFAQNRSGANVMAISRALIDSARRDAPTAVLVVTPPGELDRVQFTPGVTYAEDTDGSWKRRFGVTDARGPVTLVVAPNGKVAAKHEGEISPSFAEALRKHLVARDVVPPAMFLSAARIGHPPPNFLFEVAPDSELTLRKLVGRAVAIVFWRSASKASIDAVRDAQANIAQKQLVLAVNGGDPRDVVRETALAEKLSAVIVADPRRQITRAYGISVWPTTLSIDAHGVLRSIRYGRDDRVPSSPDQSIGGQRSAK
jgi:hypothetical protein